MIIGADATFLLYFFAPPGQVGVPIDPNTSQPVIMAKERVQGLIAELEKQGATIIVATPAQWAVTLSGLRTFRATAMQTGEQRQPRWIAPLVAALIVLGVLEAARRFNPTAAYITGAVVLIVVIARLVVIGLRRE